MTVEGEGIIAPAPRIRRSIRIAVRDLHAGVMRLLARLIVSSDGGIILSTPWQRRSGLFLSEFQMTERGILPISSTTFKVGPSGIAKCHYHKSGFTSVQSEEGGNRLYVQLPPLTAIHMQQFGHLYTKSLGWLPDAGMLRRGDVVYIQDRPDLRSISLHLVAYDRAKVSPAAQGRALDELPVSFTSGDGEMFLVDVSSTGLNLILGFIFKGAGFVLSNSPEYSMNMFRLSRDRFSGAVGVQTERDFARFGILDRVHDLSEVHDARLLRPVTRRYSTG